MNRNPYRSYRGRKTLGRRVLTAIVILLAVALLLGLVALVVLPNYAVYTADGLRFDLPLLGKGRGEPTPEPLPDEAQEPEVVIDVPSPTPSPSPTPAPSAPAAVDLSGLVRREPTLGLVEVAGAGPGQRQGGIFDMTGGLTTPGQLPQGDHQAAREVCAQLPYAVAWLAPDWAALLAREGGEEDLTGWCLALADSGYDEILFSEAVPADDGAALAQTYRAVKAALDQAGWQGRLGLVLDQSLAGSTYAPDLLPAIAQSFGRLYFRRSLRDDVHTALAEAGFDDKAMNIVTVYDRPQSVRWAWAALPATQS